MARGRVSLFWSMGVFSWSGLQEESPGWPQETQHVLLMPTRQGSIERGRKCDFRRGCIKEAGKLLPVHQGQLRGWNGACQAVGILRPWLCPLPHRLPVQMPGQTEVWGPLCLLM